MIIEKQDDFMCNDPLAISTPTSLGLDKTLKVSEDHDIGDHLLHKAFYNLPLMYNHEIKFTFAKIIRKGKIAS